MVQILRSQGCSKPKFDQNKKKAMMVTWSYGDESKLEIEK